MTRIEIGIEWRYRFTERLGILAGAYKPLAEHIALAQAEANAWQHEQELRNQTEFGIVSDYEKPKP